MSCRRFLATGAVTASARVMRQEGCKGNGVLYVKEMTSFDFGTRKADGKGCDRVNSIYYIDSST